MMSAHELKTIKAKRVVFFLAIVSVILGIGFMILSNEKKNEPQSLEFSEEEFRFENYEDSETLQETLRVIFPVGTSKEKVDRILYQNQPKYEDNKWGAYVEEKQNLRKPEEKNVVWYVYVPRFNAINIYNLQFYFDENNNVKEIADHGVPLYDKGFFKE